MEIAFDNLKIVLNATYFFYPLSLCFSYAVMKKEDNYFLAKGHFGILII